MSFFLGRHHLNISILKRAFKNNLGYIATLMVSAFFLSNCAVGPNYHKPKPGLPKKWENDAKNPHFPSDQTDEKLPSNTTAEEPSVQWWTIFQDPELVSLEKRLASQNLDILKSAQELAASRGLLLLANAERFPDVTAGGAYRRVQSSSRQLQRIVEHIGQSSKGSSLADILSQQGNQATIPVLNRWFDGMQASWEVDIWGRVRRQYEGAKALMYASQEERYGVLIAREAELASDYIVLRNLQQRLEIARKEREVAQSILYLSKSRYNTGISNEINLDSTNAHLQRINSSIPQYEQRVTIQMNAINLLIGEAPGTLNDELARTENIPLVPANVPAGIPSEVAERRPDIREATDILHAATAQVGEAEADFYPKVKIDSGFGMQSFSFSDLGMWNSRAWNVGPSITLPVFQGGRLTGQYQMKTAQQRSAAINYRKTVLNAWQEVDNALISYQKGQVQKDKVSQQRDSEKRIMELAENQYKSGLVNNLRPLEAQEAYLDVSANYADSTADVASDMVKLYNALGCGWEEEKLPKMSLFKGFL